MKKLALAVTSAIFILFLKTPSPALASQAGDTVLGHCALAIGAAQDSTGYSSSMAETELGNLLADAVRQSSGCGAAVLCGGHVLRSITYGEITMEKILRSVDGQARAVSAEITPAQLWLLLEQALSSVVLDESEQLDATASPSPYFPQISGLSIRFDASQAPGSRLLEVVYQDQALSPQDSSQTISIALSQEYLTDAPYASILEGSSAQPLPSSEAEMLGDYISQLENISPPTLERMVVLGVVENLYSKFKIQAYLPYVFLVLLLFAIPRQKHRLRNMDGTLSKRYTDLQPRQEKDN